MSYPEEETTNEKFAQEATTEGPPPGQESGEQAVSGEQQEQVTQSPTDKRLDGMQAALVEERKAKQELQRELAYIKGQLSKDKSTEQPKQNKYPIDEDAYWADPISGSDKVADARVRAALQQEQQKRIQWSASKMRKKHADFDETMQKFYSATQNNPQLDQEALSQYDPVEYAYEWVKEQESRESVESMKKRIEELEAKLSGGAGASSPASKLPKTQAGSRSAGGDTVKGTVYGLDPYSNSAFD